MVVLSEPLIWVQVNDQFDALVALPTKWSLVNRFMCNEDIVKINTDLLL